MNLHLLPSILGHSVLPPPGPGPHFLARFIGFSDKTQRLSLLPKFHGNILFRQVQATGSLLSGERLWAEMDSHLEPRESAQPRAYGELSLPPEGLRETG